MSITNILYFLCIFYISFTLPKRVYSENTARNIIRKCRKNIKNIPEFWTCMCILIISYSIQSHNLKLTVYILKGYCYSYNYFNTLTSDFLRNDCPVIRYHQYGVLFLNISH